MRWKSCLKVFNMIKSDTAVNVCNSWQLNDDAPTRLPDSSIDSTHESRTVARRAEGMTKVWWSQEIEARLHKVRQWGLTAAQSWWSVGLACRLAWNSPHQHDRRPTEISKVVGAKVDNSPQLQIALDPRRKSGLTATWTRK